MKTFKSFYEEMTFRVEVEGLPALFMTGNSPGQVKNHLRKLIKQPSMIKSVERKTKHDVKKMYRAKAQGKDLDEAKLDERTPIRPTVQDKKLKNLRIPNPNYKDGLKRKQKQKRAMYNDVTSEGTMGNKPEWGTDEATLAAKRITPGQVTELSIDTYKSARKALVRKNYSDAQKYARVAASPTSRKYKNKEMDRLDKDMERRKKSIAHADKKIGSLHDAKDCGCEKCKRENKFNPQDMVGHGLKNVYKKKMDEKLTIGKIRRAAYKTGKVLGDVQAVKKGKVAKRVKNRILGKIVGKALGSLWK